MVEVGLAPICLRVALLATLPVLAEMDIPDPVAADALDAVKRVLLARMAAAALEFFMVPAQWKIRGVMIIGFSFLPAIGLVATATLLSQGFAMRILLLVTVITLVASFPIKDILEVAAFAANVCVFPLQHEIRVVVIKCI